MKRYLYHEEVECEKKRLGSRKAAVLIVGAVLVAGLLLAFQIFGNEKKLQAGKNNAKADIQVSQQDGTVAEDGNQSIIGQNQWSTDIVEMDSNTGISYCSLKTQFFTAMIAYDARKEVSREKVCEIRFRSGASGKNDEEIYRKGYYIYNLMPIFQSLEGVKSVTCLLENCPGYCYGGTGEERLSYASTSTKGVSTFRSTPYKKILSTQKNTDEENTDEENMEVDDIMMAVPYVQSEQEELVDVLIPIIEKGRLHVDAVYEDEHTEEYEYAFTGHPGYNNKVYDVMYLDVYQLELEEEG